MATDGGTTDNPFFEDLALCHTSTLRKAARNVAHLYDAHLAPTGLRSSQRTILLQVGVLGDPTLTELASALIIDRSALARNLRPLLDREYLEISTNPKDARSRQVTLTPHGEYVLVRTRAYWMTAQRRYEALFGSEKANCARDVESEIASLTLGR